MEKVWLHLNPFIVNNKLVIVEGKKDIRALSELGINNVIEIKGPLFSFIEKVADDYKECVILTDLDREGKKLYSILKKSLNKRKVKVDDGFRNYLLKHTKISSIEGIVSLL